MSCSDALRSKLKNEGFRYSLLPLDTNENNNLSHSHAYESGDNKRCIGKTVNYTLQIILLHCVPHPRLLVALPHHRTS